MEAFAEDLDALLQEMEISPDMDPTDVQSVRVGTRSTTSTHLPGQQHIEILVQSALERADSAGFQCAEAISRLRKNHVKVSEFSSLLQSHIAACTVSKHRIHGINKEESQAKFFKFLSTGAPDLTAVAGDHQLTMWLCTEAMPLVGTTVAPEASGSKTSSQDTKKDKHKTVLATDEADIAHYVGGFVCAKLKQRSTTTDYTNLVDTIVSSSEPELGTLLAAKSRGRLTNLNKDGKSLFVELEQIFRDLIPQSVVVLNKMKFAMFCTDSDVVQACFHSATDNFECASELKDKVLDDVISLFFKIRAHKKCKNILESVMKCKHDTKKQKSLRSRLAK